eukprot:Em0014g149a
MGNRRAAVLCILIGLLSLLCDAQSPTFTRATDIAVSSSGQVFVGDSGKGVLYRLDSSLVQQESVALPSGGSILRLALTPDESRLVACLSNGNCIAYDANNLAKGPLRVFQGILSSSDSVALVSAPVSGGRNSFYVGSSNGTVIFIGQYGLDGTAGNVSRTSENLFSVTASSFTRNWYGGFVAGSYTYFVVLDVSTYAMSRPGVRVLRVCDNSNETSVVAMYEAEINCFSVTAVDPSSVLLGASLLESFPSGGASTLVIGLSTPNVSPLSRVCTVGLPSIDSSMNSASCLPTVLPWRAATTSSLSCPNRCTISSPGAIGIPSDTSNAAYLSTSSNTYTSTLAFNYESRALLFIAYTDTSGAFIQEYNITTAPPAVSFATWSMPGPVTRLTWTSGQNYVYAITSTSVVQVPIEQCSSFTGCLSCAANVNPLCGWCTVEQKCSRRSQCLNSTVSSRWVQGNTSQCLSNTIVTPTTFTLERPTNITLTISSGLPSPLTGESFLCLLSTGNGVPISVPCSRVNQTTFTFNITGAISKLNTPKLVVNIGFGSSLLNMPFATSRLTTYNCAAATSCISCLQTDGVCGWCNVEKRCTAVNTSCSNFISVTPAGGQTYLDVCPSLLNGSYLLPVAVNRPLVLNTKNLPPLISGYMYTCNVTQPNGPSITLPANYTNTTSISCVYTAAQISLSDGTSTILANINLIWTNSGTVVYPIDPLGVIRVTLYSCSAFFFTSCTSCLAVNIGTGYGCGWCGGTSRCVEPETCPSITNQLLNCPSPVLRSVSPSSGPFGGGTRLTITGTDLGVTVGDISNVTVGGVNCSVQPDGFKPGAQFVCVTGNYSYGGMPQTVPISATMRSGSVAIAQYTYVRPFISSVFPKSGPMAGGTNVTIEGMSLNVGNGVKRVLLNGDMCVILQSSLTQVTCTSSAQNVTGVGVVTVYIDNEVTINNAVTFEYTNNPNYTSVSPARTIPAGGIILTFNGTYLNVSQKALLVINGMAGTFPCDQTFTTLKCYAPPLGSNPIGSSLSPGVDYTIVMDGAPGPNIFIGVVPNPVFTSINPNDLTQVIGSAKIIRINGMNIMNVDILSEIMVTVGGERCTIDLGTTTDTVLSCQPPQSLSTSFKKRQSSSSGRVVISVGQSLSYTLGSITFLTNAVVTSAVPFPISGVAGGVAGGGVGLILLLVLVVAIIVVVYRRDSVKKRQQVSALMVQMETLETNMAEECKRDVCDIKDTWTRNALAFERTRVAFAAAEPAITLTSIIMFGFKAWRTTPSYSRFLSEYTGTIVSSDQIRVMHTIGEGEFGVVYKAHLLQLNTRAEPQLVAVKTLKGLFTMNDLCSMMGEILKMQDFHHPHVMTLIGVSFDANHTPSMVMPFMANGSLLSYLKNNRSSLLLAQAADEEKIHTAQKLLMKMCYQVVQGMAYLAENKFVHRDLAARNCMIDEDGVIKVGDFGLSEDVYRTGYFRLDKGSSGVRLPFKWLAPESIQDGVFNEKTDVWSYGVTCWEIFTCGRLPYAGVDPCDLPKLLERGRRLERPENAACPETMYSLMLKCWDSNPEDRPSFIKIGSSLSKALMTMSGYLDVCLVSDGARAQLAPQCCKEQGTLVDHMELIPVASERQDMEGKKIEMVSCEAYTSTTSQEFGIQPPVPDDNDDGHKQMEIHVQLIYRPSIAYTVFEKVFIHYYKVFLLKLQAACFYPNPTDKMYSIVAAAKALYDQLGNTKDLSIDGDSFLDLWVYAILKANIPDAVSNLQFMKEYGNPRLSNDEAGYYLTTMEAALLFIEALTPEKLVRVLEPLEFIVPERERFLGLSELHGCCLVVVRSEVKLEGYIVVAVKDWILDRSRLYRCVLVYTGSPQDVVTVSVVRIEQERAAASLVERVREFFLKPPRKGLQCISTPEGHAVVANLEECDAQDFVVWPANRPWPDLEYLMELIHTGSEQSDPTLNRKEAIPISRRTKSVLSHGNEPADLSAAFGSYNPQSYVSVGLAVQELKPLSAFRGPTVTVKADVHVEEGGGGRGGKERGGGGKGRGGGQEEQGEKGGGGEKRGETIHTSRLALSLLPRLVETGGGMVLPERHATMLSHLLGASMEFWSSENQSRLEHNFAKNHLGESRVREGVASTLKEVVRRVQLDLQRLGHLSSSCPLDGQCTTEVQHAILHFQSAHNAMGKVVWPLAENGYLTKATRVELHDQFLSLYSSLTRAMGKEIGQDFDPESTNLRDIQLFRDSVAQFQTAHNVGTCQKGALCEQTIMAIKSCMRQSVRHTF